MYLKSNITKTVSLISIIIFIFASNIYGAPSKTRRTHLRLPLGSDGLLKKLKDVQSLELRRKKVLQMFSNLDLEQAHLFDGWTGLDMVAKENLLDDIESVDWEEISKLYQILVKEKKQVSLDTEGFIASEPIIERRPEAAAAGERILRKGAEEGKAKFGGIVVAGGSGTRLKYDHSKGMFPATPIAGKSLYLSLIEKMEAAAKAYGHEKIYPFVFMLSDLTEDETIKYIKGLDKWEDVKDRLFFVRQKDLPRLIRKPGEPEDGKAFLRTKGRLNFTGGGHGDAFDYVLNPDKHVKGKVWSDEVGGFVELECVSWLEGIGVEYVQYMNVDNLLTPLADKYFIGEHVLSRNTDIEREGRAHISLVMVKKTDWDEDEKTFKDTLANVVIINGRKEAVHYSNASDKIKALPYGDPSIRLVTLKSLKGAMPTEFNVLDKDSVDQYGNRTPIYIFERLSDKKKRYGIEIGYEPDDVFAPIKNADKHAQTETPATSKKLQSNHWKKLIKKAFPDAEIPESVVIELPWEADYMSADQLSKRLSAINFSSYLEEDKRVLVLPGFTDILAPVHLEDLIVEQGRIKSVSEFLEDKRIQDEIVTSL